eukprot:CAMPEP_0197633416 /NCGR_PEP_ID=MMETSP1338-20131121/9796_1 /TAXON_ID=43686 ORGANISM="Pelagodinium beii, Strain RCC1491" /NCGR_SAMPLE_ID=MMETSP1338 /ASSEMBLY_ACC=CAM_ASM_000754 /LENGTH=74 /DNA_ID=CAMNT_0043205077 /DNA_START=187 /DNA_END=412 /DNA_ORIENTATION=-
MSLPWAEEVQLRVRVDGGKEERRDANDEVPSAAGRPPPELVDGALVAAGADLTKDLVAPAPPPTDPEPPLKRTS